uniref:Uncharacterized protein n=1 Tax=Arundo donax TaxID=35708 RepID=A0A0A9I122_ARUDO
MKPLSKKKKEIKICRYLTLQSHGFKEYMLSECCHHVTIILI